MTHPTRRRLANALCALTCSAALPHPAFGSEDAARSEQLSLPSIAAHVEQPRPFGYFVGDLVQQRVLLQADDEPFEPASLPRAERAGVWLERRPSKRSRAGNGDHWLVLEYQIVNAPQALTTIQLPALKLEDSSGTRALSVPPWPISVSPLTTPLSATPDLLQALKADRAAPTIAVAPLRNRILVSGAALVGTLVLWAMWFWWRNRQAAARRPFARALRELREYDDRAPQAWQALHRAFDRTAGRVTQTGSLAALFEKAPHLTPKRRRIELFFGQSSEFFFGRGLPADALSIRELCRELRRLEKQHER